jgi:hypothetical protein
MRQRPTPDSQRPTTPNAQFPIESCRGLGVGSWKWLGRWKLVLGSSLAALCIASAACGKKGPPLPPIVHIPSAVEKMDAKRRGNDVTVTVTIPSKNIDGTVPVDIGRIEIFGYTGTNPPPAGRFLEVGTLVGTITVPEPKPDANPDLAPPPGTPVPGGTATVTESLTQESFVAKPMPPDPTVKRVTPRPLPGIPAAQTVAAEGPLRRFYFAVPFSPRGRLGPPGTVAELRLTALPEAPAEMTATYLADAVRLEWEPSGGLIGFLLERSLAPELSPLDNPLPEAPTASGTTAALQGPTRYNVYREVAALESTTPAATTPAAAPAAPTPDSEAAINSAPIDTLTFTDPLPGLDGRRRCYVVRAVRGDGVQMVEGTPSERRCIVPLDDFPPEAPMRLSTVVSEGAITVMWEPNAESDIAGYLVLRGEPGDATLSLVTDTVVTVAQFTDRTVRRAGDRLAAAETERQCGIDARRGNGALT